MTTEPTPDAPGLPELPAADLTGYRDNVAECVFEATTPTPNDAVRWYTAAQMHAYARAALSARPLPSDWVAVPPGWKLVPIEPNWDMRNEGREFLIDGLEKNPEKLAYFLWKTMVAAAPEVK